jgi:hypothetical protein
MGPPPKWKILKDITRRILVQRHQTGHIRKKMSNKEIINKEIGCDGNTAGRAETQDCAGEQEAETRGKSACKSNDITRMPIQGASKDITPGSKKTGERE